MTSEFCFDTLLWCGSVRFVLHKVLWRGREDPSEEESEHRQNPFLSKHNTCDTDQKSGTEKFCCLAATSRDTARKIWSKEKTLSADNEQTET